MRTLSIFVVGLIVATSSGCFVVNLMSKTIPGSGVTATDVRELESFDVIEFAGAGSVSVTCGGEPGLTLTVDDNLAAFYRTEVSGGVLKIWHKENVQPTIGPTFEITTAQLKEVEVAGSGKFDVQGLDGPEFAFSVAGSGTITANGKVDNLSVDIAGSGKFQMEDLVADDVEINIAGSGSGVIHANKNLDVEVAGSGKVEYIGSPEVKQSIAGSGKVSQRSPGIAEAEPAG